MDNSLNPNPPSVRYHTFGCKVNTYDTGLIEKNLVKSEFKFLNHQVHILNTCAVTAEATKEAVRTIRRIKSREPLSTIVVTGCAAQVDTGAFEKLPGADLIVANSHKMKIPEILDDFFKGKIKTNVFKSNIFQKEDLESGGGVDTFHSRSFLKIQDGCNSFCTFCIIPYARGKSRSLSVQSLVDRANELYSQGYREVVLTGVHIGDYEDVVGENKKYLEDLVETLLLKTKVPRFRLTSLEPIELSERLLELFSDERLCPHFHMSIQSANSVVLKDMKRKYTQAEVQDVFMRIYKKIPNAFVGMDVIAGFPTETREHFEDTYELLRNTPWTRMHVFPYSERPGTKAVLFSQTVPWQERLIRASRLRELSTQRHLESAKKQIDTVKKVITLNDKKNKLKGLSRDFWNISLEFNSGKFEFDSVKYDAPSAVKSAQDGELLVKIKGVFENSELSKEVILKGEVLDNYA